MTRLWLLLAVLAVGCGKCVAKGQERPAVLAPPRVFGVGPVWVGDTSQTLVFGFHRFHTYDCKFKTLDTVCEALVFEPSPISELELQPPSLFSATDLGSGSVKVSALSAGTATLSVHLRHADGEEGVVQVTLDARVPDAVRFTPSCEVLSEGEVLEPVSRVHDVRVQVTGGDAGLHVTGLPPIDGGPFTVSDLWISDAGLGAARFRLTMPDATVAARVFAEGFPDDGLDFRTWRPGDVTGVRVLLGGAMTGPDAGLKRSAPEPQRLVKVAHLVGGAPVCHEVAALPRTLTFETPGVCSIYPYPADGGAFEVLPNPVLYLGLRSEGLCRLRADSPDAGFSDVLEVTVLPP